MAAVRHVESCRPGADAGRCDRDATRRRRQVVQSRALASAARMLRKRCLRRPLAIYLTLAPPWVYSPAAVSYKPGALRFSAAVRPRSIGGSMGNRAGLVPIRQRRSLATSTSTDLPVVTSTWEQRSGTAYPPRRMRAMVRMSHEHVRRARPWRARRKSTLRTRVSTWRGRIALVLASERNDLRLALYANNRVHRAHGLQHRSP